MINLFQKRKLMSYKNQQEAKATHDLDFIDIEGPSTYKEIDHLFQEYCKVSSLKSRTPASCARKLGNTLRTLSGTSFAKPTLTKLHETKSPGVLKKPTWEGQISQSFLNQEKNFVQIQENENNNFASRVHSLIAKSNSSGWNMSEDDATQ